MTEKNHPTIKLEGRISHAYTALVEVLEMAEEDDLFNAFQRGDEEAYENIFHTVGGPGKSYVTLPISSDDKHYEVQRRLGIGICTGLLDATGNGTTPTDKTLDYFKECLDKKVKNTQSSNTDVKIGILGMEIGKTGSKELIQGIMDYAMSAYPITDSEQ